MAGRAMTLYAQPAAEAIVLRDSGERTQADAIELAIRAWLDAKHQRSQSERTLHAYASTLASYRTACQAHGLELDAADVRELSLVAQAWAGASLRGRRVASSTYNQRLAIVSSFYVFARRRALLDVLNPCDLLERAKVQAYAGARPLDAEAARTQLAAIDRTTPAGARDFALLLVALQTGRRLSELRLLCWDAIEWGRDGRCTITWPRGKGGKAFYDVLPAVVASALRAWQQLQPRQSAPAAPGRAVWTSLERQSIGHQLTAQAFAYICERRLGTSKVHATRHTFAHAMERLGAKVSDIQRRLGHSSLNTTGLYLAALDAAENEHADALAALFTA